jgi:glutathione S-transferase
MSPQSYTLYHTPGAGSTFTLALLHLFNLPHTVKLVQFAQNPSGVPFANKESENAYFEMRSRNPLGQFPTLIVRDAEGKETVMTENAAIALYLQHVHASHSSDFSTWSLEVLNDEQKAAFFRLMVFIPVNVHSVNMIIRVRSCYLC